MDYDKLLDIATNFEKMAQAQVHPAVAMLRERFNEVLPKNDMLIRVQEAGVGQAESVITVGAPDPGMDTRLAMAKYLEGRLKKKFIVNFRG
jgi:hypothetical protein